MHLERNAFYENVFYENAFSELKTFCARLCHAASILLRGTKYRARKRLGANRKFIFPWMVINWYVFQIAKAYFRYTMWFMISEISTSRCTFLRGIHAQHHQKFQKNIKKIVQQDFLFLALKLLSRRLVVFNDTNTYRRQEFQNVFERKLCNCSARENCYKVH